MAEYIDRDALVRQIICNMAEYVGAPDDVLKHDEQCNYAISCVENAPTVDVEKMSDGYHTFADLYEQRLVLSAALAKNNPHAWKSKRHEDGSVPFGGGWFIMGFDTDEGCYTYHYELKDWDLFQCKELDKGKPWDGHTSKDVRRLLSIPAADVAPVVHGRWIEPTRLYYGAKQYECSLCYSDTFWKKHSITEKYPHCPNCGCRMDGGDDE